MAQGNIYTFTVDKTETKEVEVKRKNKETGKDEKVIEEQEVATPIEFVIKKPSRRLVDEAETQYAVELSNNLKKGIVSKAMLAKQYSDTGGALTEDETKTVLVLMKDIQLLENEVQLLSTAKTKNKKEIAEKQALITSKRSSLIDLESSVQGVYQHTADAIAERAMILWYVIQLTRYVEDGLAKPFFEGITYEDMKDDFFEKDESEDDFNTEVIETAMKAISFWFYAQNSSKKEIDEFIKREDV